MRDSVQALYGLVVRWRERAISTQSHITADVLLGCAMDLESALVHVRQVNEALEVENALLRRSLDRYNVLGKKVTRDTDVTF